MGGKHSSPIQSDLSRQPILPGKNPWEKAGEKACVPTD